MFAVIECLTMYLTDNTRSKALF